MRIGLVGLGLMGGALAQRLLDRGHDVTVHNRSRAAAEKAAARGARVVDAPEDVWEHAPVCLSLLADDAAVRAVFADGPGLGASGHEGDRALVELSTVSAETSASVAAAAHGRVDYLAGAVSGNPTALASGNLAVLVSGAPAVFERVRPVLEELGRELLRVGDGDTAKAVKLVLNLVVAGTNALICEALLLAESAGLNRALILDVVEASAVGSRLVSYKRAPLIARDYRSTFTSRMMAKDLALVAGLAADGDVELPITEAVSTVTEHAVAAGYGELDFSALLPYLQRRSGVEPDSDGQ